MMLTVGIALYNPIPNSQEMMQSYSGHTFKTDGVVNIHSVLCSDDDALTNDNNQYFPDVVIDNNGNDVGGWNHFELRHYWRPYSLPGNGPDGYAFKKGGRNPNGTTFGDKNPSMEFVEQWIVVQDEN